MVKKKIPKYKVEYKKGFIQKVTNPTGKGKSILVQTDKPGWTIYGISKNKRRTFLGTGRTEKSAITKALKKGKKTVEFWD